MAPGQGPGHRGALTPSWRQPTPPGKPGTFPSFLSHLVFFFLKSINEGESLPGLWLPLPGNLIGINCPGLFDLRAVGALLLPAQPGDPQGTVTPAQILPQARPPALPELDPAGIAPFRKLYPLKAAAGRKSDPGKGDLKSRDRIQSWISS